MRKLIVWNVVTLDGYFEGPSPWDLSFHELVWGPELEAFSLEQLREADMLVFGERTYQGMAAHWPNAGEEDLKVAPFMNKIQKVVCSTKLDEAEWNNTTILRDTIPDITRLKNEGDGPMFIFGSGLLTESLINAGLVDEIRLCMAPVILGEGRRLFTDSIKHQDLELIESRQLKKNDGVIVRYKTK